MRIAAAGATGNIGARTASFLEREGHTVVRISRSLGVDLVTGQGLDSALEGVVGIHQMKGGTAHYSGKREQERLIEEGPVPYTIGAATQFHDFAALAASCEEMAVNVLLPGENARIAPTTFDYWLAAGAR